MTAPPFDLDAFLARPLTARVATNGPTVRPTWYLWEDGAFWILTGPWARLPARVRADPAVAVVVDECDLATGQVRQGSQAWLPKPTAWSGSSSRRMPGATAETQTGPTQGRHSTSQHRYH